MPGRSFSTPCALQNAALPRAVTAVNAHDDTRTVALEDLDSAARLIRHARRETEHAAELLQGARRHPARESYDSRVRNLRAVALFAATGASVALIGAPIAAADNGPGQSQCSGPPGACPTYGNAPINNSPPTRLPAFFVPYDGARYPYGN